MGNMKIWDSVCETNPDSTKPVEFGRTFTAIDAYSQIQKATEIFGPIGTGWGYSVEWDYSVSNVVCADMMFWYNGDKQRGEFPVSGACGLTGKPKTDSEAKKKALTDGITKALSYLGFNADVFLGKFDDNKYVADMRQKFHETPTHKTSEAIKAIKACKDMQSLEAEYKKAIKGLDKAQSHFINEATNNKKTQLNEVNKNE